MNKLLEPSSDIDRDNRHIRNFTDFLANGSTNEEIIAKACFEWIRDHINTVSILN